AKCFVELARMTGYRAAIREDHRPGNLGRPAKQLAIDEVGDPAKEQTDRDRLGNDVGEREERNLACASEQQDGDRHPERAAMERHSAVPDVERLERMKDIIAGLVEEHVAEASAENDTQCRPYQEIV